MLFKEEIEKCHFEINYEFNKLINDQKEFIDSNFDLISIITKKQGSDFLVEYKQTTDQISKIVRSHGGVKIRRISYV